MSVSEKSQRKKAIKILKDIISDLEAQEAEQDNVIPLPKRKTTKKKEKKAA